MKKKSFKRMIRQTRIAIIRSGWKKAEYLKKHNIFASMGNDCYYHPNTLPPEPFLVEIGNNVAISSGVRLMTHSIVHAVFNREEKTNKYVYRFGKIIIEDNVYIGADAKINFGVTIGTKSIVAAGAVVTKDVPAGSVVAGVPAKVIGTYEETKRKTLEYSQKFGEIGSDRSIEHLKQILDNREEH